MRVNFKRIALFSLFVTIISGIENSNSQEKRELAEPVEKKYNELQPPIRVMDAIGVKPGMDFSYDTESGGY